MRIRHHSPHVKQFQLGPQHAHHPDSLEDYLARLLDPHPYRWYQRLKDRWAGRSDGRFFRSRQREDSSNSANDLKTAWLLRLEREFDQIAAAERNSSEALTTVLDVEIAQLLARRKDNLRSIQMRRTQLEQIEQIKLSDEAMSQAEDAFSTPEERLGRRKWEKSNHINLMSGQLAQLEEGNRSVEQNLEKLIAERRSRWCLLQQRVRVLYEFYEIRAANYWRAFLRSARRIDPVPEFSIPTWVADELGLGPQSDHILTHDIREYDQIIHDLKEEN